MTATQGNARGDAAEATGAGYAVRSKRLTAVDCGFRAIAAFENTPEKGVSATVMIHDALQPNSKRVFAKLRYERERTQIVA